jgi:DnaJ-class molecular chaperone
LIAAGAIALACVVLPGCEGCEKIIDQVSNKVCPLCEGKGRLTCPQCKGKMRDMSNNGNPCKVCSGTGKLVCPGCDGSGKLTDKPAGGK